MLPVMVRDGRQDVAHVRKPAKCKDVAMREQVVWVEVWVDSAPGHEYLLVLLALADGTLGIVDPQRGRERVGTFPAYDEACAFLGEEYDLVEARHTPEV